MSKKKVICVGGARPNFVKLAPLIRALNASDDLKPVVVHTGQHYDDALAGQFFRDLEIPDPDHSLGVGSGSHAVQTAEVMRRIEPVLLEEEPAAVVVVGDVNSTLAAALVAVKLGLPVVHIEAGLRSHDRSMPEEINRVVTDAISDLLLVTEESGRINLLREGVAPERIRLVGNLMIDSLRRYMDQAARLDISRKYGVSPGSYGLVTLHRPSNVDDPSRLRELLDTLGEIGKEMPLLFPVHPRTRTRLESWGIPAPGSIRFTDPAGYVEFLSLMANSRVVLTDSGGIQEETTALGIPCLTLRDNTERPVTIEQGTNMLAGTRREQILHAWERMKASPPRGRIPHLWDGGAAGRAVEEIRVFLQGREAGA